MICFFWSENWPYEKGIEAIYLFGVEILGHTKRGQLKIGYVQCFGGGYFGLLSLE